MNPKYHSLFRQTFQEISLESQQTDADPYVEGVEVSEDEAIDAIATTQLSASLEGTVKELRNGMKVKFSHGHGKISKIFTSKFFLDKKFHNATREAPLYLVKHDKGGKHSLHKASALRPVK